VDDDGVDGHAETCLGVGLGARFVVTAVNGSCGLSPPASVVSLL
jgi:hypothetical protein